MEDQNNIFCDEDGACDKVHMKSLSECISSLTKVGFSTQFKVHEEGGMESLTTHEIYKPDDIRITNFYRCEDESNPSDNAILYAIKTHKGEKGILTDAYGIYADTAINEFVLEVEEIQKREHSKDKEEK